jgi:hypothetical protein
MLDKKAAISIFGYVIFEFSWIGKRIKIAACPSSRGRPFFI